MTYPFQPFPFSTSALTIGATVISTPVIGGAQSVWIDNRGSTDVLVEFNDNPWEAMSFRIAAGRTQLLSVPHGTQTCRFKRDTGSASGVVYVAFGGGC